VHNRLIVLLGFALTPALAQAQAIPTASRASVLQLGGGVISADSGFYAERFKGIFVFVDLDVTPHLGGEFELHQIDTPSGNQVYERTYELGVRYHLTYGRLEPYAKAMAGRGVFNYPNDVANIAYNLYAGGVGADIRVTGHTRLRAEYEYQHWINFAPGTLSPSFISLGGAYRF
jgi:opacity protein-like surface antigen